MKKALNTLISGLSVILLFILMIYKQVIYSNGTDTVKYFYWSVAPARDGFYSPMLIVLATVVVILLSLKMLSSKKKRYPILISLLIAGVLLVSKVSVDCYSISQDSQVNSFLYAILILGICKSFTDEGENN